MQINTGLTASSRQEIAALLHALLADEYILYTKTRKAHWNVSGPHFVPYHQFFEEQYDQLAERIDEVAERSLKLGIKVPATLAEFSKLTRLAEAPGESPSPTELVKGLLHDHETLIRQLRTDLKTAAELGDDGTADFFTGLMEQHEKQAWMLRSLIS
jgi:starvation-inducible DNA-binding protein